MEMKDTKRDENDMTVGEIISKIGMPPTLLTFAFATWAMSISYAGTIFTYMVVFTGFIPNEPYNCTSQKCLDVRETFIDSGKLDETFYDTKTICDNDMKHGVDFKWDLSRTSFAVDFDKICSQSEISLLNSLYFVGATISLLFGSVSLESLGRRKSSILGGFICTLGTLLGFFCDSYGFMVAIRILQGIGNFLFYMGKYILVLEFIPETYRVYYSTWSQIMWISGYPIVVGICYFIHDWQFIFLASSLAVAVSIIPIILFPESPRYLMSIGKVEEARRVLILYAKFAGKDMNLSDVNLVAEGNSSKTVEGMSYRKRISEVKNHRALLLETLVQCYIWFVCCLLFFFLQYGWGSFGDTPYANYLYAACGEVLASVLFLTILTFVGRKKGILTSLTLSCICFLLAMIPWQWTELWSFERLMTIISVVGVTCSFSLAYLYTAELAPTTHRGMIMNTCSIVARCAAFTGPFVSDIFSSSTVKLGVNAILAGTAALFCLLLPETRNLTIPERAQDVTSRREKQELVSLCC